MPDSKPPFRADHVGSLLRPAALKAARERHAKDEITTAALREVEEIREGPARLPRLEDGLDGADVVMMLRVQAERTDGEAPRFPNTRELSRTFGLSERTLAFAKPDAIVMHPGPINRGVEVSPQVSRAPLVAWGSSQSHTSIPQA